MAVLQAVPDALDESDPDAPTAARLAGLLAPDETQFLYSIVLHGRAELGLAPDEYSGLVMVLLRMLAFRPGAAGASPQRVAAAPAANKTAAAPVLNKPAAAPVAPARPAVVAPPPAARVSAPASSEPPPWLDVPYDDEPPGGEPVMAREPEPSPQRVPVFAPSPLGDRWAEMVGQMIEAGSIGALVRELAMQAQCVAIDDQAGPPVWRLRVERETLRAPAQRDKLQAALSELLKLPVQLEIEAGVASDTPAQRAAVERARRQAAAEQIIHNDPLVQALMQQFKTARIVPGSVKPH